jgi:hypothetical protein
VNEQSTRRALRLVAEEIEAYEVLAGSLRKARRHRLIRQVAVPLCVLLAVVGITAAAMAPVGAPPDEQPATPAGSAPLLRLPNRLQVPFHAESISDAPPGPVPIAFTGNGLGSGAIRDAIRVAVAGSAGYRVTDRWGQDEIQLGEDVLLAPAGDRLAWLVQDGVRLLDLRTGKARTVPTPTRPWGEPTGPDSVSMSGLELLTWSPDGRSLAVAEYSIRRQVKSEITFGLHQWAALGLLDPDTGEYRRLPAAGGTFTVGFAAAFSPDGRRLAYQADDRLHIIDLDGAQTATAALPRGALLSGKGAWIRDGSGIVVAVPDNCCRAAGADWRLEVIDARAGSLSPELTLPVVRNASAVRILGWSPDGTAVAVAFWSEADARAPLSEGERTSFQQVDRADVVGLRAGASSVERLLRSPSGVLQIDIADEAIAAGGTMAIPDAPSPRDWLLSGLATWQAGTAGSMAAIAAIAVWLRRRRRRGRTLVTAAAHHIPDRDAPATPDRSRSPWPKSDA